MSGINQLEYNHYLLIFLIFMFIGWVQESVIESIFNKKLINRGFLTGPYIPVYGFGGMLIVIVCCPWSNNVALVFIVGMIACTVLEYVTGFAVEKVLKKQLWDYNKMKMKFVYKNRISLTSSLFWGLMSLVGVYLVFPIVSTLVLSLDILAASIINLVVYTVFFIDLIVQIKKQAHIEELISQLKLDEAKIYIEKRYEKLGDAIKKRLNDFQELAANFQIASLLRYRENAENPAEQIYEQESLFDSPQKEYIIEGGNDISNE